VYALPEGVTTKGTFLLQQVKAAANMRKTKERTAKMLERMCAIETEYEDAKVEVARLESRVKDDYDSDVPLGLYVFFRLWGE